MLCVESIINIYWIVNNQSVHLFMITPHLHEISNVGENPLKHGENMQSPYI